MEIDGIVQLISNVGFPIAVCCYLLWYFDKKDEQHKEEIDKMSESLNNNTAAIIAMTERLGGTSEK